MRGMGQSIVGFVCVWMEDKNCAYMAREWNKKRAVGSYTNRDTKHGTHTDTHPAIPN